MKQRFTCIVMLLAAAAVSGCDGNKGGGDGPQLPSHDPVIFSLRPDTGVPGDAVDINGVDFGSDASNVKVSFGGVDAAVSAVTDGKVTFTVPAPPADMESFRVNVTVTAGGTQSEPSAFTYRKPQVDGYGYHVGFPGEELILTGSGFRESPEENRVTFGDAEAAVLSASAERLVVRVPAVESEKAALRVSNASYPVLNSGDHDFTYDAAATALAGLDWTVNTTMEGVVCRSVETTLFNRAQTIAVLEVPLGDKYRAGIALPSTQKGVTSAICKSAGAFGGVNAAFFDTTTPMAWWDYARIGGEDVVTPDKLRNIVVDPAVNGAVVVRGGSDVSFRKLVGNVNDLARKLPGDEVLVGGPVMMLEGRKETITASAHNDALNPRTAIGVTASGKLLMVAVDGRRAAATGVNNHEHAELMRLLGAYEAMGFDGGGSTTLYFSEWGGAGVVNTPSDGGNSERSVVNAFCVWTAE